MEDLKLENCRTLNTTLAFEYSTVEADISGRIDSIMNPRSGRIAADSVRALILENNRVDPTKTEIIIREETRA